MTTTRCLCEVYFRNLGFWFLSAEQGAYDTSAQWRTPLALQIVFAVAMVAGVWLLPESPRWLMKHGQDDEARHVLGRLRANGNSDDSIVHNELAGMKQIIEETDRGGKLTVKELFSNGPSQNLRRLLLAVGAQAMQQLGGINLVTYYATSVSHPCSQRSPPMLTFHVHRSLKIASALRRLYRAS